MIRKAQENYYNDLFNEKQSGMKQMWRHLGAMLNPRRNRGHQMIKRLFLNNIQYQFDITENAEIAQTLNQHFCSIGHRLASKIPKSKKSYKHFLSSSSPNSMFLNKIDPKEVYSIIMDLKQ